MIELSSETVRSDFARTTTLIPMAERPGVFEVELDDGWTSLVGIHGGYMCALAVRGAEAVAPDRSVRTLTTTFLRNAAAGPALLRVGEVRRGRSMSTIVADLVQDDRVLLTSRLTAMTSRTGVEWTAPVALGLPPVAECVPIEVERSRHFDRADALLDPSSLPFSGAPHAMVRGYLRPRGDRRVDAAWLAMAVDWFPPPAFVRVTPPAGGVSIDLTTHIHRDAVLLEDDEWLCARFSVDTSAGGHAVEHGVITTMTGIPVAESFQTRLTAEG